MKDKKALAATALCLVAFAVVFSLHGWYAMYSSGCESSQWAALPETFGEKLAKYYDSGALWLGYCYGLAGGFFLWSALDFLRLRSLESAKGLAGSVSLGGLLAAFGCFMVGCCGSPMLAVWISLFGAASAPFLGPFAALLTTLSVLGGLWWLRKRGRRCCG